MPSSRLEPSTTAVPAPGDTPSGPGLHALFAAAFADDGDTPALEDRAGRLLSWSRLDAWSAAIGAAIAARGCVPGDRLLLQAAASPAWLALYLACLRTGVVLVPVSTDYGPDELRHYLLDATPRLAVADAARAAGLATAAAGLPVARAEFAAVVPAEPSGHGPMDSPAAPPTPDPGDTALAALLYSSGTTGRPKGAELSHANLAANARTLVSAWGFSRADRLLHALPLHHAHGLFVAVGTAWLAGSTVVLRERFDARDVIGRLPDCTVFMGVPTHYARLVAEPGLAAAARNVRLFVSGSAPLPATLHEQFTAITGQRILERYGMTETLMLTSNPLDGERRPGSVGPALPGVMLRLATGNEAPGDGSAPAEIEVRGPGIMRGYWGRPDLTAGAFTPDGWFRTGDLGTMAADGYVTIVGRSKDLVITGGLNVYPREVELVLDALPGIAESAVIGVPHPDLGEAVVAVVVPEPGAGIDPEAVRATARARLAGYKAPKRVFVAAELPRNLLGKVQKAALRERFAGSFAAAVGTPRTAARSPARNAPDTTTGKDPRTP